MILFITVLLCSLLILAYSADLFVERSTRIAQLLDISPSIVGIFVLGLGTSIPEILVSVLASLENNSSLALGNILGSNISNIGLILGSTALLLPVSFKYQLLKREMLILLIISICNGIVLYDLSINRWEATTLLIISLLFLSCSLQKSNHKNLFDESSYINIEQQQKLLHIIISTLFVLILLLTSARALVWGAVSIAEAIGVSDLIIGLTILSIGTSLPELSSSIAAARRNEHDLLVGSIIGSNIFNTSIVLGLSAIITPITADIVILKRDWLTMIGLTLMLAVFGTALSCQSGNISFVDGQISRCKAFVLLLSFMTYMSIIINENLNIF